jgi:DNA-binding NarL/FixJ family response regulator
MISVVLADDSHAVRAGLRTILDKVPGICVAGDAANGFEAIAQVESLKPDLLLLDIEMPEMDGLEAIRRLRASDNLVPILVISGHNSKDLIHLTMSMGANGYLAKDDVPDLLLISIRKVLGEERSRANGGEKEP